MLGNTREHAGANLFPIVEREDEGPASQDVPTRDAK